MSLGRGERFSCWYSWACALLMARVRSLILRDTRVDHH